jgi:hypothetical protein
LDYDILSSIKLDCPDGWSRAYRGWGERGLMSYCQIQNGPIIAAEYGSLKVKGQYKMGKKLDYGNHLMKMETSSIQNIIQIRIKINSHPQHSE